MIIYKVTNLRNGKIYIGKTIRSLPERKGEHMYDVREGSPFHFHKAINKYGPENFEWVIIERCITLNHLNLAEQAYIELYQSQGIILYNMTEGGEGGLGYKHTQESRKKISLATKGKIISEEQRNFLSLKFKGRISNRKGAILTDEQKRNISVALTGLKKKPHTEETKRKISASHKGKHGIPHTEETKKKLSIANKGRIVSNSTRQKLSEINKGKKQSEETKNKISIATKGKNNPRYGKKVSEETKQKIRDGLKKHRDGLKI